MLKKRWPSSSPASMRHSRPPKATSNARVRVERNLQLASQAVARTAGNDGQRRVAERQHRCHLVDGAVAAPGHDRRHASIAARAAASSRAWPDRSVMNTSASRPRAAISAAACSARSRATSIRPPVPEIGLMMTAYAVASHDYFLESPRRTFGVTNQLSAPARREVRLSTSIRQTPPFLNSAARGRRRSDARPARRVRARGRRARCDAGGPCAPAAPAPTPAHDRATARRAP